MFAVSPSNLHRWILPFVATGSLLAILLFLFPYNSGDTSLNSPLGYSLWSVWTNSTTDSGSTTTNNPLVGLWNVFTNSAADTQDHSYCLLVPLMVGYLIYDKRKELASLPVAGTSIGLLWIVLGLFLFWLGARAGKQYLGCAGVQVLLMGIILWFWGGAFFRKLFFAWAIIAFAWPLPFLDTTVAFPMRMLVSHSAYIVLNLVGVHTVQSGTALLSAPFGDQPLGARFQIDVADPCSGLHSLLPLLMFSAFYCYFFLTKAWHQWLVFLSAFVFAIAGNVVRILLLVFGCLLWGREFAIGTNDDPSTYHEGAGFAVFIVVLGLECLFGWLLVTFGGGKKTAAAAPAKAPAVAAATEPPDGGVPAWRMRAVFGLAAAMFVVFLVSPPVYLPQEAGVVMSLPEEVKLTSLDGGHFYGSAAPVSDVEHRLLPKDTLFERKTYTDYHEHQIFFSIVLSGLQQYTIHPPEVCLVAQGWRIVGQEDVPIQLESGHRLVVRNLSLQRDVLDKQQQRHLVKAYYMYWYVADDLTTPSHLERNLRSSWDRIVYNRDHRWAYVIAMSPITQSLFEGGMDAEQTREMLTSFIRQIVPTFQKNELREHTDNS